MAKAYFKCYHAPDGSIQLKPLMGFRMSQVMWFQNRAVMPTLLGLKAAQVAKAMSTRAGPALLNTHFDSAAGAYHVDAVSFDRKATRSENLRKVKALFARVEEHAKGLGARKIRTDFTTLTPRTVERLGFQRISQRPFRNPVFFQYEKRLDSPVPKRAVETGLKGGRVERARV